MLAETGILLKQIYRIYSRNLIELLIDYGYSDLRPSFLEILLFLLEKDGISIKEIGISCGLKKQTMTSHLNALEERGYIQRKNSGIDKRQQIVCFTKRGYKLRSDLLNCITNLEKSYIKLCGQLQIERTLAILKKLHEQLLNQSSKSNKDLPLFNF